MKMESAIPKCPPLDETTIHTTVCKHLHARAVPNCIWLHPANGGLRLISEARKFAGLGVLAGAADLILLHSGRFFALEIKRDRKSRVSPKQRAFLAAVKAAGGEAEIGYGLDDALRKLENWKLLRGTMQAAGW
jgi:hypothetical protein